MVEVIIGGKGDGDDAFDHAAVLAIVHRLRQRLCAAAADQSLYGKSRGDYCVLRAGDPADLCHDATWRGVARKTEAEDAGSGAH